MLDDLAMFLRFATGLGRWLRSPLSLEDSRRLVDRSLQDRERNFLLLLKRAVFGYPKSPYLALMKWAGIEYGDIETLVTTDGVEASLDRLCGAGVWVGLEEFKGRRPLERPGLSLRVSHTDFDNPLLAREFEVQTGGSTGARRRLAIDFHLMEYDSAYKCLVHHANGVDTRPFAIWKAVPPGSAGLKNALWAVKRGHPMERWFTPVPLSWKPGMLKSAIFTTYALWAGRLWGHFIPTPEHVPLEAAGTVAGWLAEKVQRGEPALLAVSANLAARVCMAAKEQRLDISGTVLRVGGEPLTPAKVGLFHELGCQSMSGYALSESGPIAGGCAAREFMDEVHVFRGKAAILQRPRPLTGGEAEIDALYLTTLLASTPKIMLNLESGDYAVLTRRRCGCLLEELGLDLHLHTIRSYEKLTTGGMHFMGSRFLELVEEVLPRAHGGHPTDYQFVEEERGTLTSVTIRVSPRVGRVDEAAVVRSALVFLGSQSRGERGMAANWRQGNTLTVSRCDPLVTPTGKIPALWIIPREAQKGAHAGGSSDH
jgi:hypothetical protein